jgi:hypothetical protein
MPLGLERFFQVTRVEMSWNGNTCVRKVFHTELCRDCGDLRLEHFMSERIPFYYRDVQNIVDQISEGFFLGPLIATLSRLPTAQTFKQSHFAEILAAEFAQSAMGLHLLYSKLSLLTAENANAFKMDVVLYDPSTSPFSLVFFEVKSSCKSAGEIPARHDDTAFASLFDSFNRYGRDDAHFDLTAARDRLGELPPDHAVALREAFGRYGGPDVRYAGFCVIDLATHNDEEIAVLATRNNAATFDVDLLCVQELAAVVEASYGRLEAVRKAACSG